jgi:hypothetical protein
MVDYSKWNTFVDSDDDDEAEIGSSLQNPTLATVDAKCCETDAAQAHLQLGDAAFERADYKTALEQYQQVLQTLDASCSTAEQLVSSTLNKAASTLIRLNRYLFFTIGASFLFIAAPPSQFCSALQFQASNWLLQPSQFQSRFKLPLTLSHCLFSTSLSYALQV